MKVKRGTPKNKWTQDEDLVIISQVELHGLQNWSEIALVLPGRTGKQCRERWIFALCPELNKEKWTDDEDNTLIELQHQCGNRWSYISKYLPGRSTSAIKNRWSLIKRHSQSKRKEHKQIKIEKIAIKADTTNIEEPKKEAEYNFPIQDIETFEQIWSKVDDMTMNSLFNSLFKLP